MAKRWTKEDLEFLKSNYNSGVSFCARRLNRSEDSVKHKASREGIKSNKYWKTQEDYELDLLNKGISYKVLGTYENAKTSILHECLEGHKWNASPDNILKGNNCPYCSKSGFDYDKPAILYYIKITEDNETYYKIGITNKSVQERFAQDKTKQIKILWYKEYSRGLDAHSAEQQILTKYKAHRVSIPKFLNSNGNTELFEFDILNKEVPF